MVLSVIITSRKYEDIINMIDKATQIFRTLSLWREDKSCSLFTVSGFKANFFVGYRGSDGTITKDTFSWDIVDLMVPLLRTLDLDR